MSVMPTATMSRKAKNMDVTGGRRSRGKSFSPAKRPFHLCVENEAAEPRNGDLRAIALIHLVRESEQHQVCRALILPMSFDGGDSSPADARAC